MRTKLVRVRRRRGGVFWAMALLVLSMALYIRASMPAFQKKQVEADLPADPGERVTREVAVDALSVYLVSFGGYDVMNSAKVEAARYVSRGAAGYVLQKEKLYVIGAGYAGREAAEKACVYLAAEEGMACAVIEAYSPAVLMRMTAGSAQIDAFLAAEKALRQSAQALGQLAFSVDRGEATLSQAREVVNTHYERILAVREELTAQTVGTESGVFRGLSTLLEEMTGQMDEMLSEKKTMGLSSRLKYCYVDMSVREIEMMNALMR